MKADQPSDLCNPDCCLHRTCSIYHPSSPSGQISNRSAFSDACLKFRPNMPHSHSRQLRHYYYTTGCDWRPVENACDEVIPNKHDFYAEMQSQQTETSSWCWNQTSSCISPAHSNVGYVGSFGTSSPALEIPRQATSFYVKSSSNQVRTESMTIPMNSQVDAPLTDHRSSVDDGSGIKSEPSPSPILTPDPSPGPIGISGGQWSQHTSSRRGNLQLWQFLVSLLDDPSTNGNFISWTGRGMEFKLIEPEEVARRWGIQKNRPAMNYDKLSRSLRYYYEKGIMQKVAGERYVYRFVSDPETLFAVNMSNPQVDKIEPNDYSLRHNTFNRKPYASDVNNFYNYSPSCPRTSRHSDNQSYQPLTCLQDLTSRPSVRDNRCIAHNNMDNCVF